MKVKQKARIENQVYSSRVVRSEFDKNWRTYLAKSGYVIYVATADKARIVVLLANDQRKELLFNKGGKVMVGGGGTSHYSKPHSARII